MDWINEIPDWFLALIAMLLLACLGLLVAYLTEWRQRKRLDEMIDDMLAQVVACKELADRSLEVARQQTNTALYVLRRVLTEREREKAGLGEEE